MLLTVDQFLDSQLFARVDYEISQQQQQHQNLAEVRIFASLCFGFWPPTSDDHNFLVRTSFWVFLDSMESPLSQKSSNVHVKGN